VNHFGLPGFANPKSKIQNPKSFVRTALIRAINPRLMAANMSAGQRATGEVRRILVIRPDHLGDLLFATPALSRLRQAFPEAHITGLVGPWGRAMWQDNPCLDALDTLPFPGIAARHPGGALEPYALLGRAAKTLMRERYDLGIVLRYDHWWGAALLWASMIPWRWGYRTPGMGAWLTGTMPYVPGKHEVEQDLYLVEWIIRHLAPRSIPGPLRIDRSNGEPALLPPPPVPVHDLPEGWFEAPRRVVIHPGTGAANKLWTIQGWAEVVSRLASDGWSVALTGSPDERPLAAAIESASANKPLNLAGRTSGLGQLAWLLDRAHMVLGVDSGPLHIAAALHKPTLHLYGPSDESIWGPWGDPLMHRAFRAPGTHPTMHLDVASHAIEGGPEMRAITPDMVLSGIRELEKTMVRVG
jgi:ADP-heptose:LPS heptosyltransferase